MRTKRRRFDSYPGSRVPDRSTTPGSPVTDATEARPSIAVLVLAAGGGTRMKSKRPKVLHPICGRTMIGHVLSAATAVDPHHVVAVVGHGREEVGPHVTDLVPDALLAVQETQEGTGHAVRVGLDRLRDADGSVADTVVVMYGDTPL